MSNGAEIDTRKEIFDADDRDPGAISPDDDIRVPFPAEDQEAEEEIVASDESEEQAEGQEEQEPQPEPQHDFKNPQAYARRLERDNRILLSRLEQAAIALEETRRMGLQPQQPQPQDEEIDEAIDPVGKILAEIKSIKGELARNKAEKENLGQINTVQRALAAADNMISEVAAKDPQQFVAAVAHLAAIVKDDIEERFPDKTEKEQLRIADAAIKKMKLDWMAEGKNPGVEYMRRAYRFGFRWNGAPPAQKESKPSQPARPVDARDKIRRDIDRDNKSRSIGNLDGSAPKGQKTGRDFLKMTELEFDNYLDEQMEAGGLRNRRGRTPKVSDILPGKVVMR